MDVSDLDIQYIDEDEASEDLSVVERELNEDYQPKSVRINEAGKKVRGKDLNWQPKSIFMNPDQFKDSQLFKELNENYTRRRQHNLEYGTVHHYTCKYAQKLRYYPCPHEFKVIYPSDSFEVHIHEADVCKHVVNPEYIETSQVFRWTKTATEIVANGVKTGANPTVILRLLREKGCFVSGVECSKTQL